MTAPADHELRAALEAAVPAARVLMRPIDRVAYAGDASFYRLIPRAVVQPHKIDEVRGIMSACRRLGVPLTFRAAGTSLSGQSVTDGVLVEIGGAWKELVLSGDRSLVSLQPGVIGGHANAVLSRSSRRIGPDPASIDACMIGGIIANNASGMCCGVEENAYHTLESMTCVLASGLVLDTGARDAARRMEREAPALADGLRSLRRAVLDSPALAQKIRRKYRIKNTTGYSLNALLDFEEPHRMLAHLMVGSEGTLGFVAQVVLRTLPVLPYRATALLLLESISAAVEAVDPIRASGARAVELMDGKSLQAVRDLPLVGGLPSDAAALLIEYQAATEVERDRLRTAGRAALARLPLMAPAELTQDPAIQASLWKIRKGLYPSVGAARRAGTAVIIEDVAFPVGALAQAALELRRAFDDHGYTDAILFGHAKDGNLHFVLSQSFDDAAEVKRYEGLMDDVVRLVARKYGGSLKAEHGTGRNMAPFVEAEWGAEARGIMRELKALLDPDGILNPGVILDDNPRAHLEHLKALPRVEDEVDKCIECGFCERECPSRRLTTTPRQRIAIRRELARLQQTAAQPEWLAALERDFDFAVLETCATDGLCALSCPVGINTGELVKRLRADNKGAAATAAASLVARFPGSAEKLLRLGLGGAHALSSGIGPDRVGAVVEGLARATGARLPRWSASLPRVPARSAGGSLQGADIAYFPSCLSRIMGQPSERPELPPLPAALTAIAGAAGVRLGVPADAEGHCCSMPFGSKGFAAHQRMVAASLVDSLWRWSDGGRKPVVVDAASCAYTVRTLGLVLEGAMRERWEAIEVLDAIELVHDRILPNLRVEPMDGEVLVLPNCSARKSGLAGKLCAVAEQCASKVYVPLTFTCCGTAGDRGLMIPELPRSALAPVREEIEGRGMAGAYSANLTCEMGMSAALGRRVESFVYLVYEAWQRANRLR